MEAIFYRITTQDCKSLAFKLAEKDSVQHPLNKFSNVTGC